LNTKERTIKLGFEVAHSPAEDKNSRAATAKSRVISAENKSEEAISCVDGAQAAKCLSTRLANPPPPRVSAGCSSFWARV
jgi:hypothetical protein